MLLLNQSNSLWDGDSQGPKQTLNVSMSNWLPILPRISNTSRHVITCPVGHPQFNRCRSSDDTISIVQCYPVTNHVNYSPGIQKGSTFFTEQSYIDKVLCLHPVCMLPHCQMCSPSVTIFSICQRSFVALLACVRLISMSPNPMALSRPTPSSLLRPSFCS